MLRFRTVDVRTPPYMSMDQRMTRVGRFIRNYSLDDLPNLFNVLKGDLAIIGPRPTEPQRVDLEDPAWQEILTVRPGMFSPAILQLASQYNKSPHAIKQRLEQEYARQHSLAYDLRLLGRSLRAFIASRGNPKARGQPSIPVGFDAYAQETGTPPGTAGLPPEPSAWALADRDQPDLFAVARYVRGHGQSWSPYLPQFRLVPCGDGGRKPAVFLKVGRDYERWAAGVALRAVHWPVAFSNRYVCLGFTAYFEDPAGEAIGPSEASGEGGSALARARHRLACSTVLDVASPEVEAWFAAWCQMPGPATIFFVAPDLQELEGRPLSSSEGGATYAEAKRLAIGRWNDVKMGLQQGGYVLENFAHERPEELVQGHSSSPLSWLSCWSQCLFSATRSPHLNASISSA